MLLISPNQLGRGWVQLDAGEPLKTSDQYMDYSTGQWKISSFFTSDRQFNAGKVPYRRAETVRAKWEALGPVIRKVWTKRIVPLFPRWSR